MAPDPNIASLSPGLADLDPEILIKTSKPLVELIREEDWSAVKARVDQCPTEVQRLSRVTISGHKVQAYPLHYLLIKKRAPPDLAEEFVRLSTTATSTPEPEFGSLPIHIACQHDASLVVIQDLVKEFPQGLTTPDNDGNLPIHYACSLATPEVIQFLLERTSDEALATTNSHKQNVLHLACSRYNVSVDIVAKLLETNKDFSRQRDWQGRYPIHVACMWHTDTAIVDSLLQEHPEAIHVPDVHGLTPYRICRKRVGLNSTDPTIQLLRQYRMKQHSFFVRGMDVAQFTSENVGDRLHHPHKHVHAPRNLVD